ncbi:MAG: tetratricopeptide repeat protein [Rhodobacteraceae bacterium]|nr:tetratricopeptide repeat protein [Paracoccaceae bacterium]
MPDADDLSGLPTTLPPDRIGDWNRVIHGVLSHAATTGPDLVAVLSAAPGFALGHAIRGLSCLLLARSEMVVAARSAHAAALAALAETGATPREAVFVHALGDWLDGRPTRAAARLQIVLDHFPRDALAMKMLQALHFVMGRPQAMRAAVEGVLPAWTDHPARGYILGCHAFTLEETGEYAAAERAGRRGVELAPDDAWGLHAVAHVYDTTGQSRAGLDWLSSHEGAWAHCNNFRYHVWWHRALLHLDLGQHDVALAQYDAEIRADRTDDYRDIANAASLLARLELDGVNVGRRWEELADLAEARRSDACLAFADLHYLLALCGGGRDAAVSAMVARMVAWTHLRAGRAGLQSIGGSHAQRDVFDRIAIEAALRCGAMSAAEDLMRDRTQRRGGRLDGFARARHAAIGHARARAV